MKRPHCPTLAKYLQGDPFQVITGYQTVQAAPVHAHNTVMETAFSVTVGVDYLLCPVFFCDISKRTFFFKDTGGGIVEKDDKTAVTVFPGSVEGSPKSGCFPPDQFLCMFFLLFVPARDLPSAIQVVGTFKGKSFGSGQGVILISIVVALKKMESVCKLFVQFSGFIGIPEHVVVAPGEDLPARKIHDVLKILFALAKFSSPTVVSDQNQGVFFGQKTAAVFDKSLLVFSPNPAMNLAGCF